jgi:hypothetical protein
MKTKGIRILDKENRVVSVKLPDILEQIENGNLFNWSILFLKASGHLGGGKSIIIFQEQINDSEAGLFIKWDELNSFSKKFFEVVDITIIGCKDKKLLRRYKEDREMYENYDIVIEMIDTSYWEVFSKDVDLINRLAKKFKQIIFLEPDFER